MNVVSWQSLDLNLLRVLDAMLRERSTTRAGETIGLSQSAVSAALGRLRHILGDPLFVKEGNRMVPTPFASGLALPIGNALTEIERSLFARSSFDPSKSSRIFRLLGDDYLSEMILPELMGSLAERAPGIRFQLLPANPRTIASQLADGIIEMAFTVAREEPPEWVDHTLALRGSLAVVASKRNLRVSQLRIRDRGVLPIGLFCELPHVLFAPEGNWTGEEDAALAKIGRRRYVAMTVPDFFSLARVAAQTEMLGILPDKFALSVASELGLNVFSLPFEIDPTPLHLYWHTRHSADAEHAWMRTMILDLLEPLDSVRHPISLRSSGPSHQHRGKGTPTAASRAKARAE